MKHGKGSFNVLASVEKHIEALKPLLPRQAVVCVGEYTIKLVLKEPGIPKDGPLPILVEKLTDEIDKWTPIDFHPYFVLGFDDKKIESHFWYNMLPPIVQDTTLIENLTKKSLERLHGALIVSTVWDGIGSASLPTLISKFKDINQDSLAMAILPSKVQPIDAQFNTYATLKMCQAIDGATVLLVDRDCLEKYEGVNRQGKLMKGNIVGNYLVNLFLSKETLVDEVAELSRMFGFKLFAPLAVTGASWKIYGSLENMLNTALIKPFFNFNLSTASVLYVLIRMPESLKDKIPRGKIELAIANWFEGKAELRSIYITEPIYTQDMSDRVDVALLLGGFDTAEMFENLERKVGALKQQAVERGFMDETGQVTLKVEMPKPPEPEPEAPAVVEQPQNPEEPKAEETAQTVEAPQPVEATPTQEPTNAEEIAAVTEQTTTEEPKAIEPQIIEVSPAASEPPSIEPPTEEPAPAQPEQPEATPEVLVQEPVETATTQPPAVPEPEKAKIRITARKPRTRKAKAQPAPTVNDEKAEEAQAAAKPKRTRRTKKAASE